MHSNDMKNTHRRAFTILEMLIVVGIIGIILPTVFTIMFVIFRQQAKVLALREVARQGDLILNVMQTTIKNNAVGVHSSYPANTGNETCTLPSAIPVPMNPLVFRDINDNSFYFPFGSSSISSTSSILAQPIRLNTNRVVISNFSMACNRTSTYSQPLITVGFDVSYNTSSTRTEDIATLRYETKIKMKN